MGCGAPPSREHRQRAVVSPSAAAPAPRCPSEAGEDLITPPELAGLAAACSEEATQLDGDRQRSLRRRAMTLWLRLLNSQPSVVVGESVTARLELGYLLSADGQSTAALGVWRSLVCANHFEMQPLPADSPDGNGPAPPALLAYPDTCVPASSLTATELEETWWRIGTHERELANIEEALPTLAVNAYRHARSHPGALADVVRWEYALSLLDQRSYVLAKMELELALEALGRRGQGQPIAALRASLTRSFVDAVLGQSMAELRGEGSTSDLGPTVWEVEDASLIKNVVARAGARLREEKLAAGDQGLSVEVRRAFAESARLLGGPDIGADATPGAPIARDPVARPDAEPSGRSSGLASPSASRSAAAVFAVMVPSDGSLEDPSRCVGTICHTITVGGPEPARGTRRIVPSLARLAEACALRRPRVLAGSLILTLKVMPNGEVGSAEAVTDADSRVVGDCLAQASRWLFMDPPAGGGATPSFVILIGG